GKPGHIKDNCWAKGGGNEGNWKELGGRGKFEIRDKESNSAYIDHGTHAAFIASKEHPKRDMWIVDSSATDHLSHRKDWMLEYKEIDPVDITTSDGSKVQAIGIGKVELLMKVGNKKYMPCYIHEVLYVPNLGRNLFSISRIDKMG